MSALKGVVKGLIQVSAEEFDHFHKLCRIQHFKRKELLSDRHQDVNDVFFINEGFLRVKITDIEGNEHTTHFAKENEFIADYSSFLHRTKSKCQLEALEDTKVTVLTREAIEWGYGHMQEGQKLGRLIAEYYYSFLDARIQSMYTMTPLERYDHMDHIFPNIHNRAPQHMIASYLGISPIHLSRIKSKNQKT